MRKLLFNSNTTNASLILVLAAGFCLLLIGLTGKVTATEPTSPIEIITPEDLARLGEFTTSEIKVVFHEAELNGFKSSLILFQNGKQIEQTQVKLRLVSMNKTDEKLVEKLSVARIQAVPDEFLRQVEPGIYAHKIRIEAKLRNSEELLVEEEWIRWRNDGGRVELLDIESYSALVEKAELSNDASGRPIRILLGGAEKLSKPAERTMEKPDAQIDGDGDGVRLEQPVIYKKQELKNALDESKED